MRIDRISVTAPQENELTVDITPLPTLIEPFRGKKGSVIALLQAIQAVYTYLPKEALLFVEKELNYPVTELYAVATFYAQFKLKPSGKYSIKVCKGTACHVQNASAVMEALSSHLSIKDGETTADGKYTLESVSCLGCCSLAPAMMIAEDTYGKLDGKNAIKALQNYNQ